MFRSGYLGRITMFAPSSNLELILRQVIVVSCFIFTNIVVLHKLQLQCISVTKTFTHINCIIKHFISLCDVWLKDEFLFFFFFFNTNFSPQNLDVQPAKVILHKWKGRDEEEQEKVESSFLLLNILGRHVCSPH